MKVVLRYSLLLFNLFFVAFSSFGQPRGKIEHFSDEEGLNQSTIFSIGQDSKGFLWLGTYDGLVRFDGYEFRNFRIQARDSFSLKSNRINRLTIDHYDRVWAVSNEKEVYCYDPARARFWSLNSTRPYKDHPFHLSKISITKSGRVWFLSEKDGCACICDSLYTMVPLNKENQRLKGNRVNSLLEDHKGNTWLLTDNGLAFIRKNDFQSIKFSFTDASNVGHEKYAFFSALEFKNEIWFGGSKGQIWRYSEATNAFYSFNLRVESDVLDIKNLDANQLVISTRNDGFFTYNSLTGKLKAFNSSTVKGFPTDNITNEYVNQPNQLWFCDEGLGIYKFDFVTDKLSYFQTPVNDVNARKFPPGIIFLKDGKGNLWVQPRGGRFSFYDKKKDKLVRYYQPISPPTQNVSDFFHVAYFDRQGNLWFCSQSFGLDKLTIFKDWFRQFKTNIRSESGVIYNNNIRCIYEDDNGFIWVAPKDGKLLLYNKKRRRLGLVSPQGKMSRDAVWSSNIYCIMQDHEKNYWIGTKGSGIYKFTRTDDPLSFRVRHFQHQPGDPNSLSDNDVYSIFQDSKGHMWIGTWGGGLDLMVKGKKDVRFLHSRNGLDSYPANDCKQVRCIKEDENGVIHVGTTNGLISFNSGFKNPAQIDYHRFVNLPDDDIQALLVTRSGDLYLGTSGGGIYRQISKDSLSRPLKFSQLWRGNSLLADGILAFRQDAYGNVWISSERNLVRFNQHDSSLETFPEVKKMLGDNVFSEATLCQLASGEMMVGYSDGIIDFTPSRIDSANYVPNIALTNFQLLNHSGQSPLKKSIDDYRMVTLKHNQNFFKIQFVALDFQNPRNIQYRYKLEGFDENWNYTNQERTATYTNIPRGEYVFKVSSTNGNGVWTQNERRLRIVVQPAIWETRLAYLIYFIIVVGVFIVIQKTILTIFRLRHDVKLQQQMSDMKLRFFTDISHEIRTPLTMITAPVEQLLRDETTPERVKKQLTIVSQSTGRLLKLVNQILDFRKIERKRLKIERIDLNDFVKKVCQDFTELSHKRGIALEMRSFVKEAFIWVDRESLDKILINLLSNAFKYCLSGSLIRVVITRNEKHTSINVIDNGPGISKEKQEKLFERFTNFNEDESKPSTGIGLSIVKELANRHSATVEVESEIGKGTSFGIDFLNGYSHFKKEDVDLVELIQPGAKLSEGIPDESQVVSEEISSEKNQKPVGLIVEDDTELRRFMRGILEEDYQVCEAEDGVEGYKKAVSSNPDFIVSDIMMPNRDGIEMLQIIRDDITTSHIPVILLTAKTNIESKLQGLSFGADDYVTKPFSVAYFKARIENLLETRKRLREFYTSGKTNSESLEKENEGPVISPRDKEFMDKVLESIYNNLEDHTFSVEDLGKLVGLSRSSFFNKLKSLTGMSPVEFIRDIRLKHAADLIVSKDLLIKEVCYSSGFSDLKYFGKCFKAKFHLTPMEYRKKNGASLPF